MGRHTPPTLSDDSSSLKLHPGSLLLRQRFSRQRFSRRARPAQTPPRLPRKHGKQQVSECWRAHVHKACRVLRLGRHRAPVLLPQLLGQAPRAVG